MEENGFIFMSLSSSLELKQKQHNGEPITLLGELKPGSKSVNCKFIILEKGAISKTKDDHTIHQHLIADTSGAMFLTLWDDKGEILQPGDIVYLHSGYANML